MQRGLIFKCLLWIGAIGLNLFASAQITFVIDHLPSNTPADSRFFISGNFNDWSANAPSFEFSLNAEGKPALTLYELPFPIEFKFTRGTWESVEGDTLGNATTNRKLEDFAPDKPNRIGIGISSWEDLPPVLQVGTLKIQVDQLPENTPPDAPIYACGNFNSWHPGDPRYKLEKQSDGTYTTELPAVNSSIEFKFNRGNWKTVEARRSGRARFNRTVDLSVQGTQPLQTKIEAWEDLSGNPINPFTFIWLLSAILGILLIVAILTLQNNNGDANRVLSVLILLISVVLIGRVAIYDREIFQWQPKLLLVPDLIFFLYAPIFLLYIRQLFVSRPLKWNSGIWLHFIPFVLQILAYIPLYAMDKFAFISQNVDLSLRPYFVIAGGVALVYNLFYWLYIRRIVKTYQRNSTDNYTFEQNLHFLHTVMNLKAICLALWSLAYLLGAIDQVIETDLSYFSDRLIDLLFIVFSLTVFCLGYFAIREPEIFKMPPELEHDAAQPQPSIEVSNSSPVELEEQKKSIRQFMQDEQPFLNPKLTLGLLAKEFDTNMHSLSRLINEGFGVNFNDFVNSYRVEEFKKRVIQKEYKNHTFLAIALMVGFNSKTAFNRSFKKLTQATPREYMKSVQSISNEN